MENKGYIHVYTGNGKGKTTAAFGLAIRVLCAGGSVFIGQFVKNMKYNETKIEHLFNNVRIQQFGRGCFIEKKPAQEDIDAAYAGLESCKQILASGEYNLVVLDELTIALYYDGDFSTTFRDRVGNHGTVRSGRIDRHSRLGHGDARSQTLLHGRRPLPQRDRPLESDLPTRSWFHNHSNKKLR